MKRLFRRLNFLVTYIVLFLGLSYVTSLIDVSSDAKIKISTGTKLGVKTAQADTPSSCDGGSCGSGSGDGGSGSCGTDSGSSEMNSCDCGCGGGQDTGCDGGSIGDGAPGCDGDGGCDGGDW